MTKRTPAKNKTQQAIYDRKRPPDAGAFSFFRREPESNRNSLASLITGKYIPKS
jgi:hypothetical protein